MRVHRYFEGTVTAGTTSEPVPVAYLGQDGITVIAIPGAGGDMTVEVTGSPPEAVKAGTATWITLASGVTTPARTEIGAPLSAIRFTANTVDGYFQVVA